MKIWLDGIVFERTSQFGIWRVFYEIISRSSRDIDYTIWLRSPPRQPLPPGVSVVYDGGRRDFHQWNLLGRAYRRWSNAKPPAALKQADLFHTTGFTIPPTDDIPFVVTIHDMMEENCFPISPLSVEQCVGIKRRAIDRACLIPCVSQSTAADLKAFYPQVADRVRLTVNGANHAGWDPASKSDGLPNPKRAGNALFMGQRAGYENFMLIVHAMGRSEWPREVELSVLGPPFSKAEVVLLTRFGVYDRIHHLGRLSDEALRAEYQSAACLIFPSLLEGFGFPVVEAQALGCPVVCSDIAVFHEVAGKGAEFFDPRLAEELASAVARVRAPEIRSQLVAIGIENRLRFTWEAATSQMLDVYREALRIT